MLSYQFVFFIHGLVCSVPFLIWYYRRHPHPGFRPRIGEMAMMVLFAILLSLGGSMLIGGLMDNPGKFSPNGAFNKAQSKPDR